MGSWMNILKIVRSEVRQIGESDYVLAARTFGGSFFYIVRRHLAPNFISSIMFMVVSNVGAAIGMEATLSFLGLGLPIETVSWVKICSLHHLIGFFNPHPTKIAAFYGDRGNFHRVI